MSGVLTAMSALGTGLTIASPVLGGLAAYEESKATAQAYKQNAAIAQQQAKNQAAQERDRFRRLASAQRAAYGASGVEVNTGSPLEVLADTDAEGAASVMQILYGGEIEAANWRTRSNMARNSGRNNLTSGLLGGASTTFRTLPTLIRNWGS